MDRPLTIREAQVLVALAGLDAPGSAVAREAVPFLVVTGTCGCGCASFFVRNSRQPIQTQEMSHFSNGVTASPLVGFVLWLGPDGRPMSVDVDNESGELPDPASMVVTSPYA